MYKNLKQFFQFLDLFNKKELKNFYYLIFLNVLFSFLEILNFVLIFPFFKLIFTPDELSNTLVMNFKDEFGLHNFILFYAIFFIIFSVLRIFISFFILKKNKNFFIKFNLNLSNDLIHKTINIPFPVFIRYNYSEFSKIIYNDINYFILKGLNSFILLVNEFFLIFFILIYLLTLNAYFVSFLVFFLLLIIILINKSQSKGLRELVLEREQSLKLSLFELNEFYLANKEIRFLGLANFAIPNLVNFLSKTFINYENIKFFEKKPRIILESFIYIFIVIISILGFLLFNIDASLFSIVILGFLRMTPSAAKINSFFNSIKSSYPVLEKLLYFKNDIEQQSILSDDEFNFLSIDTLELVNYSVIHDKKLIFKGIDLKVKKGDIISVFGISGSGKTSLFDSFLGYCRKSNDSKLLINGINSVEYLNSNNVSYFPQNIYLLNKSLLFNLTLIDDESKVDFVFLNDLVKIFVFEDVLINLEQRYDTICGFGGVSFSGGEKQRIGLIRSFYIKKDLIILDEFTSALDINTESKIINNLKLFLPKLNSIVFIISHNDIPHNLSNKSINIIKNE